MKQGESRGDPSVGRGNPLTGGARRGGTGQGTERKGARKLPDDMMTLMVEGNDK